MLLPSAMSFDSRDSSSPKPFYTSTSLFASPPISPPTTSHSHTSPNTHTNTNTTISSIYSTCRALQSMLSPSLSPSHLPSPPTQHINTPLISSPFKLRLRNRGLKAEDSHLPRKKITKRTTPSTAAAPPRGVKKRRRALDDGLSRETTIDQSPDPDTEEENEEKENILSFQTESREQEEEEKSAGPRTPKRLRLAPETLPFGLERSDFHALHLQHQTSSQPLQFPPSTHHASSFPFPQQYPQTLHQPQTRNNNKPTEEEEEEEEEWTTEDDRLLVELVLEKLKLSKSEWQDCARSLGRDRGSVGKRWKSLMAGGDVGLKGRARGGIGSSSSGGRRRGIYGSWR